MTLKKWTKLIFHLSPLENSNIWYFLFSGKIYEDVYVRHIGGNRLPNIPFYLGKSNWENKGVVQLRHSEVRSGIKYVFFFL